MVKKIKISNYSCYDNYTAMNIGSNGSDIISTMVRLAGRLCERFASDIIYDANAFTKAIENNENYDRYLFFRENGVTTLSLEKIYAIERTSYIQAWHLTYDAKTEMQKFTRVSVDFEEVLF